MRQIQLAKKAFDVILPIIENIPLNTVPTSESVIGTNFGTYKNCKGTFLIEDTYFCNDIDEDTGDMMDFSALTFNVLMKSLSCIPALIRIWWSFLPKQEKASFEK